MTETRTVTPAMVKTYHVAFPDVEIASFQRFDPSSAEVKFHAALTPANIGKLFEHFGWDVPGDKSSLYSYDGKLEGGRFIIESKEKLKSAEAEVPYLICSGFACHRLNLKGRKKKGFRRELRFKITLDAADACAKLEGYMMTVGASGALKLSYVEQPEQTTLVPGDVEATEEQKQAVLGAE